MKNVFKIYNLKMLQFMLLGKESLDFYPTEEQKKVLIDWFVDKKKTFNKDTPNYILTCDRCIESSLKADFNSANYLHRSTPLDYQKKIIEFLTTKPFVISKSAPFFLAKNYQLASKSISLNPFSANNLFWFHFNSLETEQLISQLTQTNYFLTSESPVELIENHEVVLSSIKNNLYSAQYASSELKKEKDIFEYLLFHDGCTFGDVKDIQLDQLLDSDYMYHCFRACSIYRSNSPSYMNNFNSFFQTLFKNNLSIWQCDLIFEDLIEKLWQDYRNGNPVVCDNIFGKICAELRRNVSFNFALSNLRFLSNMSNVLGKKYDILYSSMMEYYDIVHGNSDDKYEKLEKFRDRIASLSAFYVSKVKENFKKEKLEQYRKNLFPYFKLNEKNHDVKKTMMYQQQKKEFKKLYQSNDLEIHKYISCLKTSYNWPFDLDELDKLIHEFIEHGISKIESILEEPNFYQEYLNSKKVLKLIHRLNSHYISIDGPEVSNYEDFIEYDSIKKEYYSLIPEISEDELKKCIKYIRKKKAFEIIKRNIVDIIKSIEISSELSYKDFKKLSSKFPFNDDYYVFDTNKILTMFNVGDLYYRIFNGMNQFSIDSFMIDETYKQLSSILINDGYLWFCLLLSQMFFTGEEQNNLDICSDKFIPDLINNISDICYFAELFHMDIHNYEQLALLLKIMENVDMKTVAILDEHLVKTLSEELTYTKRVPSTIISNAKQLVCSMVTKDGFTVPRVHGETLNYRYSMYDQQDLSVLLSGIYTGACFRVDGNDNDFLHYCLLDKNGFVIKIEDSYGNFIARASGFRHGNCVFINQLRSIYDNRRLSNGSFGAEENEIIEIFEKACNDIVTISQNNSEEKNKIDYVFVTNAYTLMNYKCNVPLSVVSKIGSFPMDSSSKDWENFIGYTKNLFLPFPKDGFTTDYGNYSLICIASKNDEEPCYENIKFYDAPIAYQRDRNKIIISEYPDLDTFRKINRVKAISSEIDNKHFSFLQIPEHSITFVGDNWYIVYDSNHLIDSCVLKDDSRAVVEFNVVNSILKEEIKHNNINSLDIHQIVSFLESKDSTNSNKVLFKNYSLVQKEKDE